jgi:protein phosphatase
VIAHSYGLTDVGRRRENNQDNLLVAREQGVFAIADGMGGHAAGAVASQIAIKALADVAAHDGDRGGAETASETLAQAFQEANRRIVESVLARAEWRGMGTTVVALVTQGDRVIIGHVGDSRAYLLRGGRLQRLTDDHSWVGEQVKLGLLTDDEARRHPMRNIVTRAMGSRMELEVDLAEQTIQPGDVYLLCSDGLNSMITDDEILETLMAHRTEPEAACRALVERANSNGGEDNITVITVAIDAEQQS